MLHIFLACFLYIILIINIKFLPSKIYYISEPKIAFSTLFHFSCLIHFSNVHDENSHFFHLSWFYFLFFFFFFDAIRAGNHSNFENITWILISNYTCRSKSRATTQDPAETFDQSKKSFYLFSIFVDQVKRFQYSYQN